MEAYSLDLRLRVLALVDEGSHSTGEIAELLHVSTAWVRRLVQRRRAGEPIGPRPQRHGPLPSLSPEDRERLRAAVARTPDATLAELRDGRGLAVSISTVARALAALGLTLKKSRSSPASGSGPTCKSGAPPSPPNSPRSTPGGLSSSTRPAPPPR